MPKDVYVIDLFCGCGGFSEGARQAGAKVILAVDCWKEALAVHEANHPETEHLCTTLGGDLDEFASFLTGFIDLNVPPGGHVHIHASPPCQLISQVNRDRDVSQGLKLVNWSLNLIHQVNPHSWSLEEVYAQELMPYIESFGGGVIHMKKYGIPSTRRRIILGPLNVSRMIEESPTCLQGILDKCNYTCPTGFDRQTDGTRNGKDRVQLSTRSLQELSYTVTGTAPYLVNANGVRKLLPVDICACIQTFPLDYFKVEVPKMRRMVANAVPPKMARVLVSAIQSLK